MSKDSLKKLMKENENLILKAWARYRWETIKIWLDLRKKGLNV